MRMEIEVEVISKEIIKPSSPTPNHLNHHQLSFLDQLAPHAYMQFIYFYSSDGDGTKTVTQISNILKTSLSKVLTHYYPLAGRVKHNLVVHCSDQGVQFFEAKVKSQLLSDVIANPLLSESDLNKFLPFKTSEATEIPLGVQLSVFDCGGFAIGVSISHRIADALSYFIFVNNWAAIAKNCSNIFVGPDFSAASVFPPRNVEGYLGVSIITNRKAIITKRFVFDGAKVEALRSRYQEGMEFSKTHKRPSRVEALSAFLWNIFLSSRPREPLETTQTLYTAVCIMDLRPRCDPPVSQHAFGNYYRAATATPTSVNGEEHHRLVRQAIEEIEKIDNSYIRRFQEGYQEHLDFMRKRMERAAKGELVTLTFSSLCRFPMYDADFGWGKPAWVSMAAMGITNQIVFMDTKNGDGIESYFSLTEEDMAKFELHSEFISLLKSPIGGNVKEKSVSRL